MAVEFSVKAHEFVCDTEQQKCEKNQRYFQNGYSLADELVVLSNGCIHKM